MYSRVLLVCNVDIYLFDSPWGWSYPVLTQYYISLFSSYSPQGYFCPGGAGRGTQYPCSDPSKCGLGSPCDFSVNDQCDSSKSRLVIKSPNLLQFTKTLAIEMQLAETQESCTHAGFFCMYDRALLCPRGFYCPLGQSKRSKCLPGFYCPGGR